MTQEKDERITNLFKTPIDTLHITRNLRGLKYRPVCPFSQFALNFLMFYCYIV